MKLRKSSWICLVLILCVFNYQTAFADEGKYLNEAEQLKQINVFKGSEQGFELGREPTRLEGGIMFVKLLGAEAEALENNYAHPFTDVPEWGAPFVGYLYKMGYTKGVSETTFGSFDKMQAKSYMTFLLRALEYDDKLGDFTWNDAIAKSREINMIDAHLEDALNTEVFLRDHLAKLSLDALKTSRKGKNLTLAQKLVDKGMISESLANELNLLTPQNIGSAEQAPASDVKDIEGVMTTIDGVANFKDLNGLRFYRPLIKSELSGVGYDALDTMNIYHNDYTIEALKASNSEIQWDEWLQLEWGKFDWNDMNHGDDLSFDDYWEDYDGSTSATVGTYGAAFGLRAPTEEELKMFFASLSVGPEEDLGWPHGYYWTIDISSEGEDYHRFVDSLNNMGQQYNDTRDYFVMLVGDANGTASTSNETPLNETPSSSDTTSVSSAASSAASKLTSTSSAAPKITASNEKLSGMKDIPGVANSISIDGVLIYRPLTTDEVEAVLGEMKYDYSVPGKYGYSTEKIDDYVITVDEEKARLQAENASIDWDAWFELEWPLYDNTNEQYEYGPGTEYEGDYTVTDGNYLLIFEGQNLTITPKYLLNALLEAYPNGAVTTKFGWPTNYEYNTSSTDEFGNMYTTNLSYVSSSIHLGYHGPCYISLMDYDDVIYEKLTESSLAD